MDTNTFIVEILKSVCWPLTAMVLFLSLRKPIINLFRYIAKITYKDIEIDIKQEIERIAEDVPKEDLDRAKKITTDKDSEILKLAKTSPSSAIIESWKQTENVIYEKLKELYPKESIQAQRLTPDRAYAELSLTGALSPKEERVLQQLYFFQDSIVRHFYNEEVTKEIAIQYHDLSKYIQNKVKSL